MSARLPWPEIEQGLRDLSGQLAALEPRVPAASNRADTLSQTCRDIVVPNHDIERARARVKQHLNGTVAQRGAVSVKLSRLRIAIPLATARAWLRRWLF